MSKITIFSLPVYLLKFITLFSVITAFPVSASETNVIISKNNCRQLIHQQYDSDIDFKPGKDIHRKKVKRVKYFGDERQPCHKSFRSSLI